jgi:hypothetical protein
LAYTYLKAGETILARDQFGEARAIDPGDIDPGDTQVAMEYAFLCYETKEQARLIFAAFARIGHRGVACGGVAFL